MKSDTILKPELPIESSAANAPAHEQLNDAELTTLVAELFRQHATAIRAYIGSLTRDPELANDLLQETYLQLHQTRVRLRSVENRRAWIYRIASHVTLNELKRRRFFTWLPWSAIREDTHLSWSDPETLVNRRAVVEQALAYVPPHYRAPLLLYCSYDFSVREIAETLAIRESAVKTRLHRAREKFRVAYAQEIDAGG